MSKIGPHPIEKPVTKTKMQDTVGAPHGHYGHTHHYMPLWAAFVFHSFHMCQSSSPHNTTVCRLRGHSSLQVEMRRKDTGVEGGIYA